YNPFEQKNHFRTTLQPPKSPPKSLHRSRAEKPAFIDLTSGATVELQWSYPHAKIIYKNSVAELNLILKPLILHSEE
ncbi:MAG: hypothetical protein MJZ86_07940, partial [Bacteroidales bacterium]|nr:hypothetical protein [Bacteroidales bacterium]